MKRFQKILLNVRSNELVAVIVSLLLRAAAVFRGLNRRQQVGILSFVGLTFLVLSELFSSSSVTAPQVVPRYNSAGPPSIYIAATPGQQRNCGRSNVINRAFSAANLFLANSMASGIAEMFPAFGSEMVTKAVAVTNSRFDPEITSNSFEFASSAPHSDVMSVGPDTSDVGKFKDFGYIMMACQADLTIRITSRQNGSQQRATTGTNPILILIPATGYRGDEQITLFGVSRAQTTTEENIGADPGTDSN